MAIKDIFKVSRKTFFNPAGWMNTDSIKSQHETIVTILKATATPDAPAAPETSEESMKRQNLTDKDIKDGADTYRALAVVFTLLGLLTFAYSGFLLFKYWSITGFALGLAVVGLFLIQAFKYDFWALQMRRRQLGLTFADWKREYLG